MRRRIRQRREPHLQNRRGVTLILMTVMLVVLMGAAAFAVDFGRMYLFRAEMHAGTDAAALAGAFRVMKQDPTSATDSAVSYAGRHGVENVALTLAPGEVIPGRWHPDSTPIFAVRANWTDPDVNAVRATTHYVAAYGFGRLFGLTSHTVNVTSEAAVGFVGATTCIRPIAIPYRKLLDQLFPPTPPAFTDTVPVTYNLTPADVIALRAATIANEVRLKLGDDANSGNFYLLNMGAWSHANLIPLSPSPNWGGNNVFVDRFAGNCDNSPWAIGPGDWLQGKQGNADGPTRQGVEDLCNMSMSGNGIYDCTAPLDDRTIKVAMWGVENDANCSPRCFQVKYTGVFVVTRYERSPGGTDDGLYGYFSSMPSTGSFSTVPGPLQKLALVK